MIRGIFSKNNTFNRSVDLSKTIIKNNSMADAFREDIILNKSFMIPGGVTNIANMFYGCYKMNSPLVFSSDAFSTSVNNIDGLFAGARNYKQNFSIPLQVTSLDNVFFQAYNFNGVVFFNTENKIISMNNTFYNTKVSTLLYDNQLDEKGEIKVDDRTCYLPYGLQHMVNTFYQCSYFPNKEYFDTVVLPNTVTNISGAFQGDYSGKGIINYNLQLSNNIIDMSNSFNNTTFLDYSIDLYNLNKIENMAGAFAGAKQLTHLINIGEQNEYVFPSSIINTVNCFNNCNLFYLIHPINFSNLNKVENAQNMFRQASFGDKQKNITIYLEGDLKKYTNLFRTTKIPSVTNINVLLNTSDSTAGWGSLAFAGNNTNININTLKENCSFNAAFQYSTFNNATVFINSNLTQMNHLFEEASLSNNKSKPTGTVKITGLLNGIDLSYAFRNAKNIKLIDLVETDSIGFKTFSPYDAFYQCDNATVGLPNWVTYIPSDKSDLNLFKNVNLICINSNLWTTAIKASRWGANYVLEHNFIETPITYPDCNNAGMNLSQCDNCHCTDHVTVPALGHDFDKEGYCNRCEYPEAGFEAGYNDFKNRYNELLDYCINNLNDILVENLIATEYYPNIDFSKDLEIQYKQLRLDYKQFNSLIIEKLNNIEEGV